MARYADLARRIATLMIVAALLWPVVSNDDGLPLSTYPMYSSTRADTLAIITASGFAADGAPVQLSTPQIAQTRDPLIAQAFLNDAVASGVTDVVCQEIAARVHDSLVVSVEIARETHNVVDFTRDNDSLVLRTPIETCQVSS